MYGSFKVLNRLLKVFWWYKFCLYGWNWVFYNAVSGFYYASKGFFVWFFFMNKCEDKWIYEIQFGKREIERKEVKLIKDF